MHLYRQTLVALCAAFFTVIVASWVNEYYDLPYWILSAKRTPPNWQEALLETSFIFIAAVAAIGYITQYERRTRYLKQFHHICADCHKVRIGNKWKDLDEFMRDSANVVIAHGICPVCMRKNHPEEYRRLVALGFLDEAADVPNEKEASQKTGGKTKT